MKLHTELTSSQVHAALYEAVKKGKVAPDIQLMNFGKAGSRSHARAFEIHLGTWEKGSLPKGYRDQNGHKLSTRRFSNSGDSGASSEYYGHDGAVWAATWHEWGWFMVEIFDADPNAVFGSPTARGYGGYKSRADFDEKTNGAFMSETDANQGVKPVRCVK
jgi:hypothetical protein